MSRPDLVAAAISGLEATPILVSRGLLAPTVARRLGIAAVAVCAHCMSGLGKRARGEPWLHRSTNSKYCPERLMRGNVAEPTGAHTVGRDPQTQIWHCAQGCPNTAWPHRAVSR